MTDIDGLPEPVRRALTAALSGDADGFVAAFGATGAVDDWGRVFTGPDAIRGWSDNEFVGKQVTLDISAVRTDGDDVTLTTQIGGNGFNGPSDFVFTVDGDHVSLMRITG